MSSIGIMPRAQRLYLLSMLALVVTAVCAQTPPARKNDDLDVTMRVIVDPNAKVPDEIVRRIQLPKPAQPGESPNKQDGSSNQQDDKGKSAESEGKGQTKGPDARGHGREFGQEVSEEAKQRSEEARRGHDPHGKPPKPPKPPPPGHSATPPSRGPG